MFLTVCSNGTSMWVGKGLAHPDGTKNIAALVLVQRGYSISYANQLNPQD